jgi:membrane fusion protein (multidrug efflux system)
VPQQSLHDVHVGSEVDVMLEGVNGIAGHGKITAINSVVDEATRNMHVQATLPNHDGRLAPGMFVEVRVVVGAAQPVLSLPASAICYAPYGDSVFIVEQVKGPDGKAYQGVRQQFVKVGDVRGDQIQIIEGVKPGEVVVTSGVFKLRGGAAVTIQNDVQPTNNPAPQPEDS